MYAEKSEKNAKAFNCVQRGHQNIVENIPSFVGLFFPSALYRPQVATAAGLVRILGFVVYMRGYSSGDPQKRMQGAFGHFALLVNVGLSVEAAHAGHPVVEVIRVSAT
ncbi:MAPEG family [Phytophthora infestans]|uniref:MAPEG family n=1 Tax=Phytophthora infestans TaxID=4787 RepID=A0A8S9TVP8_PHYIN|nr:MAPEG family [Phytophthora infestans]